MSLIRTKTVQDNVGGRGGCHLWSPFTNGVYYVSVEHGWIYVRDYPGNERAKDGPVNLAGPHVSAAFVNPGQVAVTIAGFDAGTNDSRIDTYLFALEEG